MSRGQKKEKTLAKELGGFLAKTLVPDLRARAEATAVAGVLRQRWEHERSEERTAESFEEWRGQLIEQVGAAWILSCVFVRTLEDRNLVPRRRLAGEGAADSEHYFYELAPSLNARDYLLTVFKELSRFPGTEALLGPKGNAAWRLAPSGAVAQALLDLFRETKEDGSLRWTFAAPGEQGALESSTRFLGDLYQDLSESVRERYALLQTPDFVERFILGLTLDPAIQEFGLEEVRVIDPTCGSGHFLLGAYDRLFEARLAAQPGVDRRQRALAALGQVFGADINPYAVAIARFRLTLAYLEKAGLDRLADAPKLPASLVVADSLLFGARGANREFSELAVSKKEWADALFTLEEPDRALEVLSRGYHVVVGNPPYITCKDAKLRDKYRSLYPNSAAGKYALAAPFAERFFQLGVDAAFVGLINANSFMKREFGKKLIESVLPTLDLTHVIDTSGAYIPGHGTPTVILVGRNREPAADNIRAVMGKRGEPETPADPERGKVWASIAEHLGETGFENEYVSVAEVARITFQKHPWSLGGGGAAELKELMEARCEKRLVNIAASVGISCVTGEDDIYLMRAGAARRLGIEVTRPMVVGETIRDWQLSAESVAVFPYNDDLKLVDLEKLPRTKQVLWHARPVIQRRKRFGVPMLERGLTWYELQELYVEKLRSPLCIAFAEVATHNHFVLDRGGKVFKQTAPIIKLGQAATDDDHLALLGYLNSSAACFWVKQVCFPKGAAAGDVSTVKMLPENQRYAFSANAISDLPVPKPGIIAELAKRMEAFAAQREALQPETVVTAVLQGARLGAFEALEKAESREQEALRRMVACQEDIDWNVYALLGLVGSECAGVFASSTGLAPGARPFESDAPPGDLDAADAALWTRRKLAIRGDLALIETPVFKRQWAGRRGVFGMNVASWRERAHAAVRRWVVHVLETLVEAESAPISLRELSMRCRALLAYDLAPKLTGCDSFEALADEVVRTEAVPFLSALRLTGGGLGKQASWQQAWDLQRRQDAGEALAEIPVPPKYDQKDYRDPVYWRLRGKLDVPQETFVAYLGAEREDDKSPLVGWAGWDHLQRAQALAALYQERKNQDGWEKERLRPLLAGLLELVPWLKQWHNAPDDDPAKDRAGDAYASFVETEARGLGYTLDDLRAWRPDERRGRAARRTSPAAPARPSTPREPEGSRYARDERSGTEPSAAPKKRGRKKKREAEKAE